MDDRMRKRIMNLIEQYEDTFYESFPAYAVETKSGEEILEIIQNCLDTEKPLKADFDVSVGIY